MMVVGLFLSLSARFFCLLLVRACVIPVPKHITKKTRAPALKYPSHKGHAPTRGQEHTPRYLCSFLFRFLGLHPRLVIKVQALFVSVPLGAARPGHVQGLTAAIVQRDEQVGAVIPVAQRDLGGPEVLLGKKRGWWWVKVAGRVG